MSKALLWIDNLKVAYPQPKDSDPNWAVNGVSLTLQPGERLGLVGESGCGKSTLGRAVMRLLPANSRIEGQVMFEGKSVFELTPAQVQRFRGEAVALVFQDPMTRLDPLMTIGRHCIETLKAHQPQLSSRQAKEKAIATLEAVKIPASRWHQYPHEFSGGMRQRVAIALALLLNPKLILADEPTTSLDVTVAAQILKELTRLCREREMALLLISHDLALVGEYCDRIGVMYAGELVEMGASLSVFHQPQHPYTRSLLNAALHLHAAEGRSQKQGSRGAGEAGGETLLTTHYSPLTPKPPLLRIKDLKQYYTLEPNFIERLFKGQSQTIKAVDSVSLELYPGEILGLVGESGCGKSTLSRTILQLIRPTDGKVEWQGTELTTLSRQELRRQRRQMQMVFQDPHACLNPVMTVGQNIAEPLFIHQLANPIEARKQAIQMLERVGLVPADVYYERYPAELSGGQQQRVAIARALITHPKLLICDEPVSMLDASVQTQVLELMLELKQEFDLTYLFITHDLWVARFLCDRIAVMNTGRIVEIGPTQEVFNSPRDPYTQTLLQAAPFVRGCMKIRDAVETDLPAIVAIYNAAIPSRMATADLEPLSVESRQAWFNIHSSNHPIWVMEADRAIAGWLSFQSFYGRPAYYTTAEISIYIAPTFQRQGVGRQLLSQAIYQSPSLGLKTLLGLIFAHNQPSLKLFDFHGFQRWGYLPQVAELDSVERDLVIMGRHVC